MSRENPTLRCCVALAAWFVVGGYLTPLATAEETVLENASVRLVLRDGRMVSLFDKVRTVEHVAAPPESTAGLFRVQLVKATQPEAIIDATQMVPRVLRSTANELELGFTHADATVRLQVRLGGSAGELIWSIAAIPTHKDHSIGSVAYPVFETPVSSADGTVKDCLLPLYEGRLHPVNEPMIGHKPKLYPATLFAQMVACLGPAGGFLLWCDDTAGNVKEFKYHAGQSAAEFSIIHRMPYSPGAWKSPYHSRISFSGPSWYEAADLYRTWSAGQHWSATKFKDRTDLPAFLHRPHFHVTVQLGKEEDLEAIPDQLADLSRRIDAPIIVRGTYWEKHGGWVGIDYFPPSIGEEGLRSFAKRLKAHNIPLICEVAGYRWLKGDETSVVINKINKLSQEQKVQLVEFFRKNDGANVCEMGQNGQLNPSTTICRGSSFGKTFLQEMAVRLFDLGLTAFDCDSDVGPSPDGISGCFNPAHGHPVPCGTWTTETSRAAFREIRAEAARRGITDFFLMKEHCTELLNMEIHAYLSRMSRVSTEPNVVPLTQYLYHEYLPIVLYNAFPSELPDMIVYGQIPGGSSMLANQPVLSDYYESMHGHAKPFLLYGRMLRPLIPGIPSGPAPGKKGDAMARLTVPLVRQSAWDDGAGNIGVFAINTQKQEMTADVPAPDSGPWQATFYLGADRQQTLAVTPGKTLPWRLAPGRLSSIVFRRKA